MMKEYNVFEIGRGHGGMDPKYFEKDEIWVCMEATSQPAADISP
jgi:hypothetical protein